MSFFRYFNALCGQHCLNSLKVEDHNDFPNLNNLTLTLTPATFFKILKKILFDHRNVINILRKIQSGISDSFFSRDFSIGGGRGIVRFSITSFYLISVHTFFRAV